MRDDAVMDDAAVVARLRSAGCVFAEEEAALLLSAARSREELDALVERRAAGEPLEQVVGWAEFAGLRIGRRPRRFRAQATKRVPGLGGRRARGLASRRRGRSPVIVDLCCGTGALGLAVANGLAGWAELHAADLDPAAVACARAERGACRRARLRRRLVRRAAGGLRGRADILICNAPYVPTGDVAFLPAEARDHEPLVALDGGLDGLAILRRAASDAPGWLAPGGVLLVETSDRQAPEMAAAMAAGASPPPSAPTRTGAPPWTRGSSMRGSDWPDSPAAGVTTTTLPSPPPKHKFLCLSTLYEHDTPRRKTRPHEPSPRGAPGRST